MINHLALGRWNLDQPTFESHSYTVYSLQETEKSFILRSPDLYDIIFVDLMNLVKVIDIPRCKTAIIHIVPTDNKHKNLDSIYCRVEKKFLPAHVLQIGFVPYWWYLSLDKITYITSSTQLRRQRRVVIQQLCIDWGSKRYIFLRYYSKEGCSLLTKKYEITFFLRDVSQCSSVFILFSLLLLFLFSVLTAVAIRYFGHIFLLYTNVDTFIWSASYSLS